MEVGEGKNILICKSATAFKLFLGRNQFHRSFFKQYILLLNMLIKQLKVGINNFFANMIVSTRPVL